MSSQKQLAGSHPVGRRSFIATAAAGITVLLASPLLSSAGILLKSEPITVQQIIDLFIKEVPDVPIANTVDTLKAGSGNTVVTGVVTTMFATIEVIKKAIALNANFIIAHEPTYYNHADDTKWLETDDVYRYKTELLKKHNIAVWRNHDHIHRLKIDGVRKELVNQLGWQKFGDPGQPIYNVSPAYTLETLINYTKLKLAIPKLRYRGNLRQPCKKILLMPGAAGVRQITAISKYQPDAILCGEVSEWETAEYVRDANAIGKHLGLVILGHIASEESGSVYMANWLKEKYPSLKTTHVPPGNSLSYL